MKHQVIKSQNISRMCFVCGTENPAGLKARYFELDSGELLGVFEADERHQGYPGRLHGGIATALLDETIGRAVNLLDPDAWGVTVELGPVRFRKPVPLGEPVRVVARTTSNSSRLFEGTGELVLADGTVAVEAQGKYLKLPIARIAEGDFTAEWFEDNRQAPEAVDI